MSMQLEELFAKTLVDEVGLEVALKIVHKAEELFRERHPGMRMNPDYIRMEGCVKIYAGQIVGRE